MRRRLVLAAALAGLPWTFALAQDPPTAAGTARCGGLLCDLYYSGKPAPAPGQPEAPDPTHLPCRDFLCAAFGGRTPDPAPPAAETATAPTQQAPTKSAKRRVRAQRTAAATGDGAGK